MRLLINAIPLLGEESGIGNYTRHIAQSALAQPDAYDVTFFYGYPSKKLATLQEKSSSSWLGALRGLARRGTLPRRLAKKALFLANRAANFISPQTWDCYFEPNFVLLPTISASNKIITIHDFSCFRYPQWHPEDRVAHMQKFFWQSVQNATHIITVSETIRQEAANMFGIAKERITAIPNGVSHEIFQPASAAVMADLRQRYGLPAHFILYVGALEPRKNLCNLLTAHSLLPQSLRQKYPLILVGAQGWINNEIMELIHRQAAHTRLVGHVPLADLPAFYSACDLFAYPSWYEGFGLPVLEAMACGRPVLASEDPALMELCEGNAIHAQASDIDALAKALRQILEDQDLRQNLGQAARKRAQDFSWATAGQRHLQLFSQLAGL